jgi:hypothetical protein
MYLAKRRLAHDEYEFALLFQHNVGGAVDQVIAEAVRNRGERAHAAGRDDHAEGYERAARDCRALVADRVVVRGQVLQVFERVLGFMRECARRPLADDEMSLDGGTVQHL